MDAPPSPFSDSLIEETRIYFRDTYDHPISVETAISYLTALAEVYAGYLRMLQEEAALSKETSSGTMPHNL